MYEEKFSLSFYLKLLSHKLKIIYHTWSISLGTFCIVRQFYDFHVKIPSFIFTMTNWFSRWRDKQSACTVEVFFRKKIQNFHFSLLICWKKCFCCLDFILEFWGWNWWPEFCIFSRCCFDFLPKLCQSERSWSQKSDRRFGTQNQEGWICIGAAP